MDAASQPPGYLHVESDYAFHGMDPRTANRTTVFVSDTQYETQVSYERLSPVQLESRPPIGPNLPRKQLACSSRSSAGQT